MLRHIMVPGVPALPTFSHGTISQGILYASGMIGFIIDKESPAGFRLVGQGDPVAELLQALKNHTAILRQAYARWSDVPRVIIYCTDLKDAPALNLAYLKFMTENANVEQMPARVMIQVAALPLDAQVEIVLDPVPVRRNGDGIDPSDHLGNPT